ncbi:hypothetical protein SUGI_0000200 [Cryptomeria japonica]|nr:hypothetical protein SUGI_0000200 [Cryptomeria japonica]
MNIVSPSNEFLDVAFMNIGVGATERGGAQAQLDESQNDSPLDFAEHRRLTSINESSTVWGGLREAKALWAWDIAFDNCGICKSPILELCVECQSNPAISEECGVAWGACNHTFHLSLHKQMVKDKKRLSFR